MRGHEKIIEARKAGKRPSFVFINDYPCQTDWFEHGDHATVCTSNDPLSSIDLRFLVGIDVSVSATSESRAMALFEKAKAAGVKQVAACHVQMEKHALEQNGWTGIWKGGQNA